MNRLRNANAHFQSSASSCGVNAKTRDMVYRRQFATVHALAKIQYKRLYWIPPSLFLVPLLHSKHRANTCATHRGLPHLALTTIHTDACPSAALSLTYIHTLSITQHHLQLGCIILRLGPPQNSNYSPCSGLHI